MSTHHEHWKSTNTARHWHVLTPKTLHGDSTISGLLSDQPQKRRVTWLTWTSLPNKLKCKNTVMTLRYKGRGGGVTCMNRFAFVPRGLVRLDGVRWYTTESQIVCSNTSGSILCLFFDTICSKWKVTTFSETAECFLCICWSCSHFSTNRKANWSEVDACSWSK